MCDTVVHFLASVYFLHGRKNNFHRQKFHQLVTDVERRIKYQIPLEINDLNWIFSLWLLLTNQTPVATKIWGVFLRGAKTGSANKPFATIPPAKTTNMYESQQARGCLREKVCAPATERNKHRVHTCWIIIIAQGCVYFARFCLISDKVSRVCDKHVYEKLFLNDAPTSSLTISQVLAHRQRRQGAVRDVEVGKHFQFHHLIGDVQESFGIHCGCLVFLTCTVSRNYGVTLYDARERREHWRKRKTNLVALAHGRKPTTDWRRRCHQSAALVPSVTCLFLAAYSIFNELH